MPDAALRALLGSVAGMLRAAGGASGHVARPAARHRARSRWVSARTKRCCRSASSRFQATGCCRNISRFRSASCSSRSTDCSAASSAAPRPKSRSSCAQAGRHGARTDRRCIQLRASLHARDQPVRAPRRPHSAVGRAVRISRDRRPHPADGLRGLRDRRGDGLSRGRRRRAALRAVLPGARSRHARIRRGRTSRSAAKSACARRASASMGRAPATSAARRSSRSSMRRTRPITATCASSA